MRHYQFCTGSLFGGKIKQTKKEAYSAASVTPEQQRNRAILAEMERLGHGTREEQRHCLAIGSAVELRGYEPYIDAKGRLCARPDPKWKPADTSARKQL